MRNVRLEVEERVKLEEHRRAISASDACLKNLADEEERNLFFSEMHDILYNNKRDVFVDQAICRLSDEIDYFEIYKALRDSFDKDQDERVNILKYMIENDE